jgi:signal transduction histidine kinase
LAADQGHHLGPSKLDDAASSDLAERVKELDCLYQVAAIFAERGEPVRDCLERVVVVLASACRFPDLALAELTLDDVEVCWPECPGSITGPRIIAPLRVGGQPRGEVRLAYRDPGRDSGDASTPEKCDLFIAEEQALLDAVARQVGVFVAGVESERHRRQIEATLWHADRLATIGQLAAGVAHELNEPICSMLGFAQLALKSSEIPSQVRSDLDRIVDAALHGREIIHKLLLFARQTPASKRPVSMNDVVDEAMFLLEAGCDKSGIRFVRDLAMDLPQVPADPVQLRQVITNLIINAMHAIDGVGTVTVRTVTRTDSVELLVADTGFGMSDDVRRRIFDPFFTTKDIGEGTGLGLSIVQGIVAGHGGSITVESEPDVGSIFRVRFPLKPSEGSSVPEKLS